MSGWAKRDVIKFIQIYKSQECLWQTRTRLYSSKPHRDRAYSKLLEFVKTFDPTANKDTIVKRICNIRNCFRKACRKVERNRAEPGADESDCEPTLWYYPYMEFLKEYDQDSSVPSSSDILYNQGESDQSEEFHEPRNFTEELKDVVKREYFESDHPPELSISSSIHGNDSNFSSHSADHNPNSDIDQEPIHKPKKRRKASAEEELAFLAKRMAEKEQNDFEECIVFGKHVASKFRRITQEQRIHAEKLINDVLYFAQLEQLSTSFSVVANGQDDAHDS